MGSIQCFATPKGTERRLARVEAASFLYALIELLNEKEFISIEELDERKKQVAERLVRMFVESGTGCGRGAIRWEFGWF